MTGEGLMLAVLVDQVSICFQSKFVSERLTLTLLVVI